MSNKKQYSSYVVDLQLPPAVIVSPALLTLGYTVVLFMDYILLKNDTKLRNIISPKQLRFFICVFHFILPIIFASKYDFGNISFMLHPWTNAAQIMFLTKSNITFKEWIQMMFKFASFQDESPTTDTPKDIRLAGIKKVVRGIAKFAFMKLVLDGLLPEDLSSLLAIPFYKPQAMFITYILAVRIYCMLGVSDVIMGVVQSLFLIRFQDVFDNPFISSRFVCLFYFWFLYNINSNSKFVV